MPESETPSRTDKEFDLLLAQVLDIPVDDLVPGSVEASGISGSEVCQVHWTSRRTIRTEDFWAAWKIAQREVNQSYVDQDEQQATVPTIEENDRHGY